ncbi:MAG: hypothetical protein M3539_15625 [Acidobacteriota bacterium]|nr:hypothetical protein [Acidobacteriota bacterium]
MLKVTASKIRKCSGFSAPGSEMLVALLLMLAIPLPRNPIHNFERRETRGVVSRENRERRF